MSILNKILVFVLVFAILIVVKYGLEIYKAFRANEQWKKTVTDEIILGTALSYIFTIIFTGFY